MLRNSCASVRRHRRSSDRLSLLGRKQRVWQREPKLSRIGSKRTFARPLWRCSHGNALRSSYPQGVLPRRPRCFHTRKRIANIER